MNIMAARLSGVQKGFCHKIILSDKVVEVSKSAILQEVWYCWKAEVLTTQ